MSTKKVKVNNGHIIDPHCSYQDGEIYVNDAGTVYSCTLNMTDIKTNKNKFYIMQVIKNGGSNILFIRYGRIGESGRISHDSFASVNSAISKFERQFKSKTRNAWSDKDNFSPVKGKYHLCDIDYGDVDTEEEVKKEYPKSKLKKRVQEFISLVGDINQMKNTMMELDIDTEKMPLGKISSTQIQLGYDILNEIKKEMDGKARKGVMTDLSSDFYTVIPYACRRKKPPVIDNDKMIDKFTETLDELKNIEIAANVIKTSEDTSVNPIDAIYEKLDTNIKPLKKGSKMWKVIEEYVHNTHAPTHNGYGIELLDIYEIARDGERDTYDEATDGYTNRMLLWHGTRLTNYISILQKGLLLRPDVIPGTYITGKMFGYGIYGASSFSKSFNYTGANKNNPIACLFLAEFGLGNPSMRTRCDYYITKDSLEKEGCQSTWGRGKTTPGSAVKVKGVIVPNGKLTKSDVTSSSLLYDEYIVYDQRQINLRYIVKVKGLFKY